MLYTRHLGEDGEKGKEEKTTYDKKCSGFYVLPQLGDILPDFYLWGEISRSPLSLRRGIFIPPVHTLGPLSDYSTLTSDLILFQ